jgi:hypothetical protein
MSIINKLNEAMTTQERLQRESEVRKSIRMSTNKPKNNRSSPISIIAILFTLTLIIGEVKCIIKMIDCNWEPIGKSEIIYTVGTFTGLGCIIGYIDIKDK